MATKINQKEYLKRYLSNDKDKKKKKKKDKKSVIKGNVRIIDDDLDLSKLQTIQDDEVDVFGLGEDAPQIVGIIDERPAELRAKEEFSNNKWKVVAANDGFDTTLQVKDVSDRTAKTAAGDQEPRRRRRDSDESPPRKASTSKGNARRTPSDESPPRRKAKERDGRKGRTVREESDESPPRRKGHKNESSKDRTTKRTKQHGSDASPPRKPRHKDYDESPPRRKKDEQSERRKPRHDSDGSPPRRPSDKDTRDRNVGDKRRDRRRSDDSDESPPRKSDHDRRRPSDGRDRRRDGSIDSPPRRSRWDSSTSGQTRRETVKGDRSRKSPPHRRGKDSDESPPRRRRNDPGEGTSRRSPPHKRAQPGSSRDVSPPVRIKQEKDRSDSDLSPPRRTGRGTRRDSDESPPRRKAVQRRGSPHRYENVRIKQERRSSGDESPPRNTARMSKTLDGKRAGLQDARALHEENEKHRRREAEAFEKMSDEHTGRFAQTVVREKSGRRRDIEKELREEFEKRKEEEKKKEMYARWGKGVKQVEEYNAKLQEAAREMEKPLARYADDKDLDEYLKQQDRDGDPMLEYLRQKRKEENKRAGVEEKPIYQGSFPDNRFGIRPGYRWDGVVRTNGYEKRWFEAMSKRKATEEEAYKYSVEDM